MPSISFNNFQNIFAENVRPLKESAPLSSCAQNPISMPKPLSQDVFQKSISFKGATPPQNNEAAEKAVETNKTDSVQNVHQTSTQWNEDKLKEIYNNTYEEFLSKNPITKEMNIQKPSLVFDEKPDDYMVAYSFATNSITVSPYVKEPFCLVALYNDDGKIEQSIGVVPESKLESCEKYFKTNKNLKKIILNDKEKELYLSASCAHELRHWEQLHLLASTEGYSDRFLNAMKSEAKNLQKDLVGLSEAMREEGENPERVDQYVSMLNYSINYQPARLLGKDTKIKLSMHPKDTRYFSVTHFAKSILDKNVGLQEGTEAYKAQSHEADAFNYQFEFFDNLMHKNNEGTRPDVLGGIMLTMFDDAREGLYGQTQYGYDPVITE